MLPVKSIQQSLTLFALALVAALFLFPEPAHAQDLFGSGTNFLNALVNLLTQTWARLLAIIAIVITGIMWLTGRLNMGWFISVTGGLILIFGAASIVDSVQSSI